MGSRWRRGISLGAIDVIGCRSGWCEMSRLEVYRYKAKDEHGTETPARHVINSPNWREERMAMILVIN